MKAIERSGNPVTQVRVLRFEGNVWLGAYGGAKLIASDECVAITSDGVRHAL